MLSNDFELATPILLVALPQVLDPFFHKSVVLLLHHDEEGSLGFILNRPTEIRVSDILQGMEVHWEGRPEAVAHFGGPVQPQLGTVLFDSEGLAEGHDPEAAGEVLPGLGVTQHVGDLSVLAEAPPEGFRLILGYAGWGEGQLMQEILRNDWLTAPVSQELIFASKPESLWEHALRSVGVDPAALPSWMPAGGGGTAH
jgi:putative transcriptional regulator